ncbi:hypothetical protein ACIPSA_29495 [Streptomyces sp. NPDC086549]|uniref:hypothetical protein n=1 Tax=Streptomyces sp. NPDC086549 TaxID=3365752 RepID=UPI00381D9486
MAPVQVGPPRHGHRVVFEGTATVHRSDWGLDGTPALATAGVLVSDKPKPILDISAVQLDQAGGAWTERCLPPRFRSLQQKDTR